MFARKFSVRLKPNSLSQFTDIEEKQVIPVIRKLRGFRDLMAFVSPSGTEAFVITLWDSPESAEAYGRGAYPRLVETLATVTEGTPAVETYNVSNSTWHNIAAAART
jgi:heme-degrading monooxygenase HmoA